MDKNDYYRLGFMHKAAQFIDPGLASQLQQLGQEGLQKEIASNMPLRVVENAKPHERAGSRDPAWEAAKHELKVSRPKRPHLVSGYPFKNETFLSQASRPDFTMVELGGYGSGEKISQEVNGFLPQLLKAITTARLFQSFQKRIFLNINGQTVMPLKMLLIYCLCLIYLTPLWDIRWVETPLSSLAKPIQLSQLSLLTPSVDFPGLLRFQGMCRF